MSNTRRDEAPLGTPRYIAQAQELIDTLSQLSKKELAQHMKLSPRKAEEVAALLHDWKATPESVQIPAIDAFRGDIYSGLQAQTWSHADRLYAHRNLLILSGLYGVLHACDGVMPYRLEMGYRLPGGESMYDFWNDRLAHEVAESDVLVNVSSVEYTRAILPYVKTSPVITPKFMTISPKTGEPVFVTVHAKIARGTFASWMVRHRVGRIDELKHFNDVGYEFNTALSTTSQPVFVCKEFGGIGLSVRRA